MLGSTITINQQAIAGFLCGIASHLLYFKHGEHHRSAPRLFMLLVVSALCLPLMEAGSWAKLTKIEVEVAAFVLTAFHVGLFGSVLVYRILYHPLGAYPGPFLARTSKFWLVWQDRSAQNHLVLHNLFEKYGEFVRTGPAELAISAPEALQAIDGPGNHCTKAEWYDILYPLESVILVRDKPQHDRRRRVWDAAYKASALGEYEFRIRKHARNFQQWLLQQDGKPIRANECCDWYSFDIVGDLAFGKPFDLFKSGQVNHAVAKMHAFMGMLGIFSAVPWLCLIGISIPGVRAPWMNFMKWCGGQMANRIENREDFDESDTSGKLIAHSIEQNTLIQDLPWLNGDAITMIVAGSDSVGQVLTWVLYYLAIRPEYQDAVREEVAETGEANLELLSNQPVISSIINEILRLHPVVPTGGLRKTGDQSIVIKGHVVPPHTTISVSRWTIARREDCYERATEFIPERWTTKPWMIKNRQAWSPFCTGRYSCVGKNIAYRELACAVAWIVPTFDIKLAPGETGKRISDELRDCFAAAPGPLNLVFNKRTGC